MEELLAIDSQRVEDISAFLVQVNDLVPIRSITFDSKMVIRFYNTCYEMTPAFPAQVIKFNFCVNTLKIYSRAWKIDISGISINKLYMRNDTIDTSPAKYINTLYICSNYPFQDEPLPECANAGIVMRKNDAYLTHTYLKYQTCKQQNVSISLQDLTPEIARDLAEWNVPKISIYYAFHIKDICDNLKYLKPYCYNKIIFKLSFDFCNLLAECRIRRITIHNEINEITMTSVVQRNPYILSVKSTYYHLNNPGLAMTVYNNNMAKLSYIKNANNTRNLINN